MIYGATLWLLLAVVGDGPPQTFQFGHESKASCEEMRAWLSEGFPIFPLPCVAYKSEVPWHCMADFKFMGGLSVGMSEGDSPRHLPSGPARQRGEVRA